MINETNNNDQTLNDSLKQNSPEECDVKINNKEKGNYEAASAQTFCSYWFAHPRNPFMQK